MRYLLSNETDLLFEIAQIHESIPKKFDITYNINDLDVALRFESMKLLMTHCNDQILLIEDKCSLRAFIWFHIGEIVHIKSTYVRPYDRNNGLATQLKRQVETIAEAHHINTITSDVHPNNFAMITLNKKLGYAIMRDNPDNLNAQTTSLKMIKTIEV